MSTRRRTTIRRDAETRCFAHPHNEQDADLIEWFDAQPAGKRSEAIRDLLRDGLRMRELGSDLSSMVRQAVAEALANVQVFSTSDSTQRDTSEVEEAFGDQLDQLLGRFR